ncbi:hypothetical protein BX666DRAFT_465043 [Dichotomocladium elegans]|nr:hypothetical protein BX666DRAFT_465043 [Dichotomocladium elegans]
MLSFSVFRIPSSLLIRDLIWLLCNTLAFCMATSYIHIYIYIYIYIDGSPPDNYISMIFMSPPIFLLLFGPIRLWVLLRKREPLVSFSGGDDWFYFVKMASVAMTFEGRS